MGFRPIFRPPSLIFSTRAGRLSRLQTLLRAARDAGADGVDLDLSGRLVRPSPHAIAELVADQGLPVQSLWVPTRGRGGARCWASQASAAAATARLVGASALVVRLPTHPGEPLSRTALTGSTEALRGMIPSETRVVVAVGGGHLVGGRSHLAQLSVLRRLAEEWDFEIALDLFDRLDPRWEAEAAVTRLGARLTLLRVPAPSLGRTFDVRSRIVTRTVASALDAGRPAIFALVPAPGGWHTPWSPARSREWASASQQILARYSAVEAERILDVDPRPRPGFRA